MRARQTVTLLAGLALLLGAHGVAAQCSAEPECVKTDCGDAYGVPISELPYWTDYTTTGDSDSTTFKIKICTMPCNATDPMCQPLEAFRLRLADAVIDNPGAYIRLATPSGGLQKDCANGGPGWWIRGGELLSLANNNPATSEVCEVYTVSVFNAPGQQGPTTLSDICKQGVKVVDANGNPTFVQKGPSCVYTYQLANGMSGVGEIIQRTSNSPSPAPAPKPTPSPSPDAPAPAPASPDAKSPSPSPSPSPKPKPSPRPTPSGYYGSSTRRLQQAPFVRSLLHDGHHHGGYYGGHRRLAEVPLPAHFGGARVLTSYYGSHGAHHEHRRRLMSAGQGAAAGRGLLHNGHHHGGYYGGHRRRLQQSQRILTSYYGRHH